MRTTLFVLAAILAALPVAANAVEDKPPKLEPVPDIAPPAGIPDAELEPQVTINRKGENKIEEFRMRGRLYMIKVTPRHGKPYYLVDQRGDGQMRRYDDLSPNFVVPMWMIKEF
ncbi:MAG: DUF2782 domain-containing protein [Thiobacillus sp.]|nr:DUF2782 domain-containing protein [Thiobacillus sp.]